MEGDPYEMAGRNPGQPAQHSDVKRVLTSIARAEILDGFTVIRTRGVGDTVRWYAGMTRAIEAAYNGLCGGLEEAEAAPTLTDVMRRIQDASAVTGERGAALLCGLVHFAALRLRPCSLAQRAWRCGNRHGKTLCQSSAAVGHVWGRMLCQVPGVSLETARRVLAVFPTPVSLCQKIRGAMEQAIVNGTSPEAAAVASLKESVPGLRG